MKAKNLTDITKILTQNNYKLLNEFQHPMTKKRFLLFQASNDNDYNMSKVQNLINNPQFSCYKILNMSHYKQFVINKKD